jgi:hypothetical protein
MDYPEIIRSATYEKEAKKFPVHDRKPNGGIEFEFK